MAPRARDIYRPPTTLSTADERRDRVEDEKLLAEGQAFAATKAPTRSAHTATRAMTSPGPWSVTDPADGSGELIIVSRSDTDDAEDVASVDVSRLDIHPNAHANATLLAGAPAMADALRNLTGLFRSLHENHAAWGDYRQALKVLAAIDGAAGKAGGR